MGNISDPNNSNSFINASVEESLGFLNRKAKLTQTYSGIDIRCVMYLPLLTRGKLTTPDKPLIQTFADLQTFSISSTRSVSPVRVLGRSSPLEYTRGARTFAGTLAFATINKDAFAEIYDVDIAESYENASTSIISDLLPPFSIVMTASNETGGVATHVVHGVTLVNYGTTYSIDNLYTETTYSYVATDIKPLVNNKAIARIDAPGSSPSKTVGQLLAEELFNRYTINKKTMYDDYLKKVIDQTNSL